LSTFKTGFSIPCSCGLKQGEGLKPGRRGQGQMVLNGFHKEKIFRKEKKKTAKNEELASFGYLMSPIFKN